MTFTSAVRGLHSDDGLARRFHQLKWAVPLLGLSIACIPIFVLFIVGIPLIFLTVGIPLVLGMVGAMRGLCNANRHIFRSGFGVRIENPYRPWPKGNVFRQILTHSKDVTVWRDFAWHAIDMSLGAMVYIAYIGPIPGAVFALIQPFLNEITPPGVFDSYFGFIHYGSLPIGLVIGVFMSALYLVVWWTLGDIMITAYARLAGVMLRPTRSSKLEQRVVELTESRADTVDSSAAELRRIERDLHDGAQARLVALGMSLGMAEEIMRTDPEQAASLLAEARENSQGALAEIRNLVRGIHPPVLADRGLAGAVEALALAHPLPVEVTIDLPGRPPEPVETAAYFAVAEALTNVAKYAKATQVRVMIGYFGTRLGITVRDNGIGGAAVSRGGGLEGLRRRLGSFDGTVTVKSPVGGPTVIALEIPCELGEASQPRQH
ncbi:MAG TPA: sensor histidine kinase [Stackebrandtia sp.]|jgi:signal transduction histidine kinase|uniref:sensor histidine kinase n=1 Tax=Stackebrandtia sp. TaxID=2023065 RepID=UPI002D5474EA|nr:sensor histidine kinase [Stackebrandtia sp.]HZE42012.1 sensor histidine kinase [Stackebrandtia sp.]